LKIEDGDPVIVKSRRGEVELRARLTDVVRPGMVFATMHSARHLVNQATHEVHDPFSKQPAFKRCAIAVRRKTA
jgi:anaerobic selenocysteine-containing dehydrogenase